MTALDINHYLSIVLSFVFIAALVYFSGRFLFPKFSKFSDMLTRRTMVEKVNHLQELEVRLQRAEITRASYLKAVEEDRNTQEDLSYLVNNVVRVAGGFAMIEAMDNSTSHLMKYQPRVEDLLECAVAGLTKQIGDEKTAEKFLQDEISVLLFDLDLKGHFTEGMMLRNPAQWYFTFEDRQKS